MFIINMQYSRPLQNAPMVRRSWDFKMYVDEGCSANDLQRKKSDD